MPEGLLHRTKQQNRLFDEGRTTMMNVQVKDNNKMYERLSSYQALLSMMGYEDCPEDKTETEPPKSKGLGTGGGCLL